MKFDQQERKWKDEEKWIERKWKKNLCKEDNEKFSVKLNLITDKQDQVDKKIDFGFPWNSKSIVSNFAVKIFVF